MRQCGVALIPWNTCAGDVGHHAMLFTTAPVPICIFQFAELEAVTKMCKILASECGNKYFQPFLVDSGLYVACIHFLLEVLSGK